MIRVNVNFAIQLRGDNSTTEFTVDLRKHPVSLYNSGIGQGFPSPFDLLKTPPSNIVVPGGNPSVSLDGYLATFTFSTAPSAGVTSVQGYMEFDT